MAAESTTPTASFCRCIASCTVPLVLVGHRACRDGGEKGAHEQVGQACSSHPIRRFGQHYSVVHNVPLAKAEPSAQRRAGRCHRSPSDTPAHDRPLSPPACRSGRRPAAKVVNSGWCSSSTGEWRAVLTATAWFANRCHSRWRTVSLGSTQVFVRHAVDDQINLAPISWWKHLVYRTYTYICRQEDRST